MAAPHVHCVVRCVVCYVRWCLQGGLRTLTSVLVSDNLFVRGQAIDALLQITGHEGYDWFREPRCEEDRSLHAALRGLAASALLDNLCRNQPSPFPGASFMCLQILAFWLSWVRSLYTGVWGVGNMGTWSGERGYGQRVAGRDEAPGVGQAPCWPCWDRFLGAHVPLCLFAAPLGYRGVSVAARALLCLFA
jgi:hypothetical protein